MNVIKIRIMMGMKSFFIILLQVVVVIVVMLMHGIQKVSFFHSFFTLSDFIRLSAALLGFCSNHGKIHEDPTTFLPSKMKLESIDLFRVLLQNIVNYSRTYCSGIQSSFDLNPTELYTLYLYFDDFHTINEFTTFYNSSDMLNMLNGNSSTTSPTSSLTRPEEDISLLSTKGFIKLKSGLTGHELTTMMPYFQNSGYIVRGMNIEDENRYTALTSSLLWMENLSLACDGMCYLIGNVISPDLLKSILFYDMFFDKSFSKLFNNLLLSLMALQPFKMTAGIAYCLSYTKLCYDFAKGHGVSGSTMFNLSVQFLNREVFVHEICYHYSFLSEAMKSLHEIITIPKQPENSYFNNPAISHRRYGSIIGDLKVHSLLFAILSLSLCSSFFLFFFPSNYLCSFFLSLF
jgi:hypothetical protein